MFHYVYVLLSLKDFNFYTGKTKNLKERLQEHNEGKNVSTAGRRPLRLIYFEGYLDAEDAGKREIFLKSGSGKRFINKQLNCYLSKNKPKS